MDLMDTLIFCKKVVFTNSSLPSYTTEHIRLSRYHRVRRQTTISSKKTNPGEDRLVIAARGRVLPGRLSAKSVPHCLDLLFKLRPLCPDFFVAGWKIVAVRASRKILLYGTFFGLAVEQCPFGFAAVTIQLPGVHIPLLCDFRSQIVVIVLRGDIDVTLVTLQAAVGNHVELVAVQYGLFAT